VANLSEDGNYFFAFRCMGKEVQAVYLTPEILENADIEMTKDIPTRLLFKVDGGETIDLPATVDSALRQLRLTGGNVPDQQVKLARDAIKSISVAVKIGGVVFHETRIGVRGSTSAISKFMSACGISEN
jgi:hypothetical protein